MADKSAVNRTIRMGQEATVGTPAGPQGRLDQRVKQVLYWANHTVRVAEARADYIKSETGVDVLTVKELDRMYQGRYGEVVKLCGGDTALADEFIDLQTTMAKMTRKLDDIIAQEEASTK